MFKPLISVIIPTYKRPSNLLRAIKSVLYQTYSNWELIIVDDNNNYDKYRKETQELINNFKKNYNIEIKYIKHEKNKGGSAARNTGIRAANGEYIAFLDDDDTWEKNKLKEIVDTFKNISSEYGVCFSSYYVVTKGNKYVDYQPKTEGYIYKKELFKDYVSPTSAVVVKKECFNNVGYFDESLPARQDYDMWLRISKFYKFKHVNKPLVTVYKNGTESISSDYKNHVKGTKIVLDKIRNNLEEDEYILNKIFSEQYCYLGKFCCNQNAFVDGKKFFLKSIKYKFNFKSLILYFLTFLGPTLWKYVKLIVTKIRIMKKGDYFAR